MSVMNITPEQIQKAIESMSGGDVSNEDNPALEHVEQATRTNVVRNVTKVQNGELRCIVTNNNLIKPSNIVDGATYQDYDSNVDVIAWISIIGQSRNIYKQDQSGIHECNADEFDSMFGDKAGYALSYLSSFGGNNNILLDKEKLDLYDRAKKYADELIGDLDNNLKTFISSMCVKTPNFLDNCQTWDEAKVYDCDKDNVVINWGCTAKTNDQYVSFETRYIILWARPIFSDSENEVAPDGLIQLVTRQVNPDIVPNLGQDSVATFTVDETINNQIAAYAIITEDTLNGLTQSIELHKNINFDVSCLSS